MPKENGILAKIGTFERKLSPSDFRNMSTFVATPVCMVVNFLTAYGRLINSREKLPETIDRSNLPAFRAKLSELLKPLHAALIGMAVLFFAPLQLQHNFCQCVWVMVLCLITYIHVLLKRVTIGRYPVSPQLAFAVGSSSLVLPLINLFACYGLVVLGVNLAPLIRGHQLFFVFMAWSPLAWYFLAFLIEPARFITHSTRYRENGFLMIGFWIYPALELILAAAGPEYWNLALARTSIVLWAVAIFGLRRTIGTLLELEPSVEGPASPGKAPDVDQESSALLPEAPAETVVALPPIRPDDVTLAATATEILDTCTPQPEALRRDSKDE